MAASPYSLEGAREILSGPDSRVAKAVGTLLGIGVLAAGPIGAATGSAVALAVWGWVDQKNELVDLLGQLTSAGRERLRRKRTLDRGVVLAATHTALAHGAFFAALREILGPVHDEIGLTDEDKQRLTRDFGGGARQETPLPDRVAETNVALPWAGCGFRMNRDTNMAALYLDLAARSVAFLSGFAAWARVGETGPERPLVTEIADCALSRYDAEYKRLAADVPEFAIWAMLGEHEATQASVARANESLVRLEGLLIALAGDSVSANDRVREANAALNRALLDDPILSGGAPGDLPDLVVPTIREGYLSPPFRWAVMDGNARPADEAWWADCTEEHDIDAFLAAYFASPQSHVCPLVVLGHPGSGKSMLTKVCTARLSASEGFTAVRIPLRQVTDPTAATHQQVSGVLDRITNGRVSWKELSEATGETTRVLLIDGLDEFMQATGAAESNYLQNVVEFQRVELRVSRPVAVIVTSRTLVADLAQIPKGCLIIKLEDFSEDQVHTSLAIWARGNPRERIPSAESVLSYGPIARQPLLLLLLVLHGAANGLPRMAEDSTQAQIYGGILRNFIRRELGKPTDLERSGSEETRILGEIWRLSIAAFGMFSRGRHYIDEQTLLDDLRALDPASQGRLAARRPGPLSPARRVLGKFFFIHSAEADDGLGGRSYEFLHATFSEYLIAHLIVAELEELSSARERPSSQIWDDDRLYALLSHQLLDSGGSAILTFFEQLASNELGEILRVLVRGAESRWGQGRYAAYAPIETSYLRRFVVYSANLVMLLLRVVEGPVTLSSMAPADVDAVSWWSRMLKIWDALLRPMSFTNQMMPVSEPELAIARSAESPHQYSVHLERLAFNATWAEIFNAGYGVLSGKYVIDNEDPFVGLTGYVARKFVDQAWPFEIDDVGLIRRWKELSRTRNVEELLMTHVARHPEKWSESDVRAAFGESFLGARRLVEVPRWLLAMQ